MRFLLGCAVLFACWGVVLPAAAHAQSGFTPVQIASQLNSPVSMAIAPDGRVFIAQQGGDLRVVKNDVLLPAPFLTAPTVADDEEGLLAVAFDPGFANNQFVYVTYTVTTPTRHNRIVRYTASGDVALPNSAVTIFDLDDNVAHYHIGGAIHFGTDGKLYTTTGDNADSSNSQRLTTTHGKILRLNADGSIPSDNPTFGGQTTGKYRAIWASGFRNAFTFDVQPGTGRIFINDVGGAAYEEINDGIAGSNYGWPTQEGPSPPGLSGIRYPVHSYEHSAGACAITGGTFYNPASVQFPNTYLGRYFFGEYCTQTIRYIDPASPGVSSVLLSDIVAGPVDIRTAPDGAIYYLSRGNADPDGGNNINTGVLTRVSYSASGAPQIGTHPQPQTVAVGSSATFTVSASGTAPLSYRWQKNTVDIPGALSASYTTPATTLGDNGAAFRCIVTNGSGTATSNSATLTVANGHAPNVTILTPAVGAHYDGGDLLSFSGSATDQEQGTLGADAFSWRVDFHHNDHTHPGLPLTSGITSGTYDIPRLGETSTNVFYRVILQVTDASGLSTTVTRDVLPNLGSITINTSPPGLEVHADSDEFLAPANITGVIGVTRHLTATSPQIVGGVPYGFVGWSDGSGSPLTIQFPAAPTTYVANFVPHLPLTLSKLGCSLRFDRTGRDRCNVRGTLANVPAGFDPAGKLLLIDIGGARVPFLLDSRGRATTANGAAVLLVPSNFTGGSLKLRVRLLSGTWASAFADEGVNTNATVRNQALSVDVSVPLGNSEVHSVTAAVNYRGTAGKRGRFRLQ